MKHVKFVALLVMFTVSLAAVRPAIAQGGVAVGIPAQSVPNDEPAAYGVMGAVVGGVIGFFVGGPLGAAGAAIGGGSGYQYGSSSPEEREKMQKNAQDLSMQAEGYRAAYGQYPWQ